MPHAYEAMRDKFKKGGMSEDAAQAKAARIYNARRKPGTAPVTGNSEEKSERPGHKLFGGLKKR